MLGAKQFQKSQTHLEMSSTHVVESIEVVFLLLGWFKPKKPKTYLTIFKKLGFNDPCYRYCAPSTWYVYLVPKTLVRYASRPISGRI
jgi:hypothetical protein